MAACLVYHGSKKLVAEMKQKGDKYLRLNFVFLVLFVFLGTYFELKLIFVYLFVFSHSVFCPEVERHHRSIELPKVVCVLIFRSIVQLRNR